MSAQNFPPNFDASMSEILRNDAIISQNLDEWKFFNSYLGHSALMLVEVIAFGHV